MAHLPRTADANVNWNSFAPITSYDHAGYVWIAVLYCLILSTLVLVTRAWIKKNTWGNDDSVFLAATVAQLGHVICVFVALEHGLGRAPGTYTHSKRFNEATGPGDYAEGGRAAYAGEIFLVLSLTLTKISVIFFLQRLLSRESKVMMAASYALIGVFAVWGLASIITTGVDCSPSNLILDDSAKRCSGQGRKFAGIAAVDVFTELLIIAFPVVIVWPLQMSVSLKVQVAAAFLFRIGVVATAIVHAVYVARYERSQHPSLAMVPTVVIAEAEMCWSLVSATIPNLKNFMRSFSTGFGHEFGLATTVAGSDHMKSAGSYGRKGSSFNIPLSRLSKKRSITHADEPAQFVSYSHDNGYEIEVSRGGNHEARSVGSGRSEEMIIRKDVTMTVDHNQSPRQQRRRNLF